MELRDLVLHALTVKKSGTADQIAEFLGRDRGEIATTLSAAAEDGLVAGGAGIHMATPAGRQVLDELYPVAYAEVRSDPAVEAAADRFEVVNRKLLDLLTRWQTTTTAGTSVPNDHSDVAYDTAILDELGELHERAEPTLGALSGAVPRLEVYGDRLERAYDRALAGETDYVSGVRVDSYHTVWHELHEDLLRVLGRTRQE